MQPKVTIDLVTEDQANKEIVLYLVEDGPWPSGQAGWSSCLKRIQDRILSAADVAIAGNLASKYPEAIGLSVRIQVDSPSGSPAAVEDLVAAVGRFLLEDATYSAQIKESRHIAGIRVVTGAQMGRFNIH